ncbi:MAG: hypothetical protein ABH816_00025 [Candidatus Levyibacteriota bacterium]
MEIPKYGPVFAEFLQGLRNAVKREDLTPNQALEKSERTLRELACLQLVNPGKPLFGTDCTQVEELIRNKNSQRAA